MVARTSELAMPRADRRGRRAPGQADPGLRRPDPRRQRAGRQRAPPQEPTRTTWLGLPARQVAGGLQDGQRPDRRPRSWRRMPTPRNETILDQVRIAPGELWIVDRNFCVRTFLFRIRPVRGIVPARQHLATLPFEPSSRWRPRGDARLARSLSRRSWWTTPTSRVRHRLRRIVLRLDQPTREGERRRSPW